MEDRLPHKHIHTQTHTHIEKQTQAQTDTHTHTHTHTHRQTHTVKEDVRHKQVSIPSGQLITSFEFRTIFRRF